VALAPGRSNELQSRHADVFNVRALSYTTSEFVTAPGAPAKPKRVSGFRQAFGNGLQHLVAELVTEAVVHVFEVVDVEKKTPTSRLSRVAVSIAVSSSVKKWCRFASRVSGSSCARSWSWKVRSATLASSRCVWLRRLAAPRPVARPCR